LLDDLANKGGVGMEDYDKLLESYELLKTSYEQLLEQNKRYRLRIFELRAKTGYRVYEENLRLAQENARLKDDKDLYQKLFVKGQLKE
jgi:hypothetical protein